MQRKKQLSNEAMLRALFKDLHPIEAALLRNELVTLSAKIRKGVKRKPEQYINPIVSIGWFVRLCDKIDKFLGFDK